MKTAKPRPKPAPPPVPEATLDSLLRSIAADPTAGPWGEWAESLLKDKGRDEVRKQERPG